jgi:hypothetical protein
MRVTLVLTPKQRIAITIGDQFVIRIQLVDVFYGNNLMLHESRRRNMTTLFDGYSCIFSTRSLPAEEMLSLYFNKDLVEKAFRSLKRDYPAASRPPLARRTRARPCLPLLFGLPTPVAASLSSPRYGLHSRESSERTRHHVQGLSAR